MPRLVGSQPHTATKGAVVIAILVAIALVLELLGAIDLVPRVGRSSKPVREETQLLGGSYV